MEVVYLSARSKSDGEGVEGVGQAGVVLRDWEEVCFSATTVTKARNIRTTLNT
jgi:hypothetical protein